MQNVGLSVFPVGVGKEKNDSFIFPFCSYCVFIAQHKNDFVLSSPKFPFAIASAIQELYMLIFHLAQ